MIKLLHFGSPCLHAALNINHHVLLLEIRERTIEPWSPWPVSEPWLFREFVFDQDVIRVFLVDDVDILMPLALLLDFLGNKLVEHFVFAHRQHPFPRGSWRRPICLQDWVLRFSSRYFRLWLISPASVRSFGLVSPLAPVVWRRVSPLAYF